MKIDNIKEEVTHNMENLRRKTKTEIQNTMEGYSSRLEQAEDRSQNLNMKRKLKQKLKNYCSNNSKPVERNMQKLTDSIKRPNLRTMGIEEGEEVQAKEISNIFNKIITNNFPNLVKIMPIQVQEASRTPNRHDQNRSTPQHIVIKKQAQRIQKAY
jgi:hypothetical protein